jgi:2-polyprenyl-6-methoxyphenol hydroxylase-like FAD-dependent oxidoreductase
VGIRKNAMIKTRCCIVGGGPAGMMLGLLLARAGVDVAVLEKHGDFLRDFRGDTIHPSTLELMHELGILEEFLRLPHDTLPNIGAQIGDDFWPIADFTHLPTICKYVALMPQWDFLDFIAAKGGAYPHFHLHMNTEATDLITESERIVGVRAKTPHGEEEFRADLVVGADGRHSTVRAKSELELEDTSAPMDVLWMRISRQDSDDEQTLGRFIPRHVLIMINRRTYWQCAFLIPKGQFEAVKAKGLDDFRATLVKLSPFLRDRVGELKDWDQIKLLTVAVDRLKCWHRPGLLCIGDSAHAMSPVGGVGINLAIQDAVATANLLTAELRGTTPISESSLEKVQQRRMFPTRMTQRMQVFAHKRVIRPVLNSDEPPRPALMLHVLKAIPFCSGSPRGLSASVFVRSTSAQRAESSGGFCATGVESETERLFFLRLFQARINPTKRAPIKTKIPRI